MTTSALACVTCPALAQNAPQAVALTTGATPSAVAAPTDGTAIAVPQGDIVVTASRRSEKLQNTPISVSVLGGQQLDQATGTGLSQLLNAVPGVAATVDFQTGGTQLAIRGVSAAGPTFDGGGTVAYYLDALPFGFVRTAIGPDLNPYDLNRVEILRGPQGTLYGAGGLNGVVRVITNDPDVANIDAKGRAILSGTAHGGTDYGGDAELNVPIIDNVLAVRAVLGQHHYSGWINSIDKNHVNDAYIQTYRVKILAKPTDNFSAQFSFWRNSNSYGAPSDGNGSYFNNAALPDPIKNSYNDYGLKLNYQGPGFTVTSDTGYLEYSSHALTDLHPVAPTGFQGQTDLGSRVYTEELNLASSTPGPFRWSVGGFYRDAKDTIFQPLNTPGGQLIFDNFEDGSRSYAFYGEVGYKFFDDKLELTGGLRYFHDASRTQALSASDLGPVSLQPFTANFNAVTPRAVLQWFPDTRHSFYLSYSQGFRSGVVQDEEVNVVAPNVPPAQPDRLHNYEAGAKGTLFNNLFDYNVAAFYIHWSKVQQVVSTPVASGVYVGAIVNGASASGPGAEASVSAHLARDFRVAANLSWNNLTLDDAVYSSGILLFDKGQRLNYSPKYTLGGSANWTIPLGENGHTAAWGTSVSYTTKQQTTTLRGTNRVVLSGDDMFMLNTQISFNTVGGKYTVALFADNLTDNNGSPIKSASTTYFDLRVRPRTVGLEFSFHL